MFILATFEACVEEGNGGVGHSDPQPPNAKEHIVNSLAFPKWKWRVLCGRR